MVDRQGLQRAIREADARLDRLRAECEQYADDPLLDDGGKWSVRDCLSHVAASARVTAAGQRAIQRLSGEQPPAPAPGGPSVDEPNQQQIEERKGKSVAELIDEAKQGHAVALRELQSIDDATLAKQVPEPPGRPQMSVGGNILRSLEFHEAGQLDRIENAIRLRTRWN